jgi:hypothetical protein
MRTPTEATPAKPEKFSSPWYSKPGLLYFIAAGRPPVAIKIGVTQATTMKTRLKAIQSANHEPVELLGVIRFDSGEKPLLQAEGAARATQALPGLTAPRGLDRRIRVVHDIAGATRLHCGTRDPAGTARSSTIACSAPPPVLEGQKEIGVDLIFRLLQH